MNKKWVFISIISIMLITLSIYAYTVNRSHKEEVVEKNVIEFLNERNEKMYATNLIEMTEIIEKRVIGDKTFFIVHQEFNTLLLKEAYNYPITAGLRLDDYVMIEKIDRFFTYPEYKVRSSILINNKNSEQCYDKGICNYTYIDYANDNDNELEITGINKNNASKIKITFENQTPIIIDVKGKPYILEIVEVEKDFIFTLDPDVEFIYD